MRSWLARAALVIGLVACGDRSVEQMTAIKAKVCACKTVSCAEQEIKAVAEARSKDKDPNKDKDPTHRVQVLARDMVDCLARLQAAERPTEGDGEASESTDGEHEHGGEDEVPDFVPRVVPGAAAKTQ